MATLEVAAKFTRFPDLPIELRRQIWEAALPGPRLVNITQRQLKPTIWEWERDTGREWPDMEEANGSAAMPNEVDHLRYHPRDRQEIRQTFENVYSFAYNTRHLVGIYSDTPPPEIIYVCREARDVVLQHYTLAFYCAESFPQTYFDFAIDTLYLRTDSFGFGEGLQCLHEDLREGFPIKDLESMKRVKRLAIQYDDENNEDTFPEGAIADILKLFGGVEELSLVLMHFQDEKDTMNDHSDLALMQPWNVYYILDFYEDLVHRRANDGRPGNRGRFRFRPHGKLPATSSVGRLEDFCDLGELEECRVEDCKQGQPWSMPKLESRVVAPFKLKAEVEYVISNQEKLLEEHVTLGGSGAL